MRYCGINTWMEWMSVWVLVTLCHKQSVEFDTSDFMI